VTSTLLFGIYVFVLAMFVGFEVITKVPPTLHTPLMSGANAVSGITIVGALLAAQTGEVTASNVLGFLAIVFATVNVVGGFLVTDRMLGMFGQKKKRAGAAQGADAGSGKASEGRSA
jgi:NAD(P) transhydrogenase subunit alpha